MTETTELRELLSKRGVKWKSVGGTTSDDGITVWLVDNMPCQAAEIMTGGVVHLALHISALTPEQAVAATLGREECDVIHDQDGVPRCSKCQNVLYDEYKDGIKNYCDECGAKAVVS